jgi:CysZ protein
MRAFAEFAKGAHALVRGARAIAADRRLWPYAAGPIVVAAFAFALGVAGGVAVVGWLAERLFHGWTGALWGTLRWVALALAYVSAFLASIVAAKVVILPIVAGPFNALLSERLEALRRGSPPSRKPYRDALRDLLPGMWHGALTTAYGLAVLIGCLPLLLVPALGALLYLVPSAYVEALGALDATFARKGMTLGEKHAWLLDRLATVLGFGAAIVLGNLVPPAALLVVPAAAAGGTLLVIGEPS